MKQLIKRIFNIPTITQVSVSSDRLAELLSEPLPTGGDVLDWYNRNIPANDD